MYENEGNIEHIHSVVLDPSLLTINGLELLQGLMEENKLKFVVTPEMRDVMENRRALRDILLQWGEYPGHIGEIYDFIKKLELSYRVKVQQLDERTEIFISKELIPEIKYSISRNYNVHTFLSNEMALAIGSGIPILCISASPEWKIVEFFKRVGAKIGNTVSIQIDKKSQYFKTNDFRKLAIASALSAAIVIVSGGPAAVTLGCAAITIAVYADP